MRSLSIRLVLGACALVSASALVSACSSDDPAPANGGSSGSSGSSGAGGGNPAGACFPVDPSCGISGSECQAKVDNSSSDNKTLRMSMVRLTKPAALSTALVQRTILTAAIELEAEKCFLGKIAQGGLFNWLIDFNPKTKKLKTGGAKPVVDPDKGYCFFSGMIEGKQIDPVEFDVDYDDATQTIKESKLGDIIVPVFQDLDGTKKPILLPLSNVHVKNTTMTENGNCIGRFRGDKLLVEDKCLPSTNDVTKDDAYSFEAGGTLTGHISMQEADEVVIADISQTLCRLLTNVGEMNGDIETCPRGADGKVDVAKVEAMVKDNRKPDLDVDMDGKRESYTLEGAFAASAIKINDTCQ